MSEIIQHLFVPLSTEGFKPYVKPNTGMPPISTDKLSLDLYSGEARVGMEIPFTGDDTFVLRYKKRQGAFSSVQLLGTDLSVLQLQGAKQEGFRVDAGLYWVALFTDQILQIAENPDSEVERLMMPLVVNGLYDAIDRAIRTHHVKYGTLKRYEEFASRAKMKFSDEERSFVRDIKRS